MSENVTPSIQPLKPEEIIYSAVQTAHLLKRCFTESLISPLSQEHMTHATTKMPPNCFCTIQLVHTTCTHEGIGTTKTQPTNFYY